MGAWSTVRCPQCRTELRISPWLVGAMTIAGSLMFFVGSLAGLAAFGHLPYMLLGGALFVLPVASVYLALVRLQPKARS
jgi:hypothetical protein